MSTSPCSKVNEETSTQIHQSSNQLPSPQLQQLPLIHRKSSCVKEQINQQMSHGNEVLDDEDEEEEDDPFKPPDGGWGWIVVLASFLCNLVVDGIIFSFGLFLQDLVKSFNQNKGTIAWIGSLQAGCYLVVGK